MRYSPRNAPLLPRRAKRRLFRCSRLMGASASTPAIAASRSSPTELASGHLPPGLGHRRAIERHGATASIFSMAADCHYCRDGARLFNYFPSEHTGTAALFTPPLRLSRRRFSFQDYLSRWFYVERWCRSSTGSRRILILAHCRRSRALYFALRSYRRRRRQARSRQLSHDRRRFTPRPAKSCSTFFNRAERLYYCRGLRMSMIGFTGAI